MAEKLNEILDLSHRGNANNTNPLHCRFYRVMREKPQQQQLWLLDG